jgi:hypothetical protein
MQSLTSSHVLGIVLACVAAMLTLAVRALLGRRPAEIDGGTVSERWLADLRRVSDDLY